MLRESAGWGSSEVVTDLEVTGRRDVWLQKEGMGEGDWHPRKMWRCWLACTHSFSSSGGEALSSCASLSWSFVSADRGREGASLLLGGERAQVLDLDPGWSPVSPVVPSLQRLHK